MSHSHYDTIYKRLDYLWNNEVLDRCCVSVTAPKDPQNPWIEQPNLPKEDLRKWYYDPEMVLAKQLDKVEKTYYAGDALPIFFTYFGTGGQAKYVCPQSCVGYGPDTIWIHPSVEDLEEFDPVFDPATNPVFQEELNLVKYLCAESKDRFFVGMPDNCGSYDALSQLRGVEDLMMDFLVEPESVKQAAGKMIDILHTASDYFFQETMKNSANRSFHAWMFTASQGKHMQMQCDLSVMISNQMYKDFIVEELERTSSYLDHATYHLDGMEQIKHLDDILGVKNINMIQWTQVAGQPEVTNFLPELQKIQRAGKGLVLTCYKHQVETLLNNLALGGLHLVVLDASNPQEADDIVAFVEAFKKPIVL